MINWERTISPTEHTLLRVRFKFTTVPSPATFQAFMERLRSKLSRTGTVVSYVKGCSFSPSLLDPINRGEGIYIFYLGFLYESLPDRSPLPLTVREVADRIEAAACETVPDFCLGRLVPVTKVEEMMIAPRGSTISIACPEEPSPPWRTLLPWEQIANTLIALGVIYAAIKIFPALVQRKED